MTLRFFVPGRPQTAGSKTAVPTARGARVIEAGSRTSRARKRSWRGDLQDAALRAMGELELLSGPLTLTVVIVRRRPVAHMRSGVHAGTVKDWALRLLPVQMPDVTKQIRAVEDAFNDWLWGDDAQVVHQIGFKAYGDQAGLRWDSAGVFVAVDVCAGYMGPDVGLATRRDVA